MGCGGADTALWFIRNVVRIEMSKKVHQASLPKKIGQVLRRQYKTFGTFVRRS